MARNSYFKKLTEENYKRRSQIIGTLNKDQSSLKELNDNSLISSAVADAKSFGDLKRILLEAERSRELDKFEEIQNIKIKQNEAKEKETSNSKINGLLLNTGINIAQQGLSAAINVSSMKTRDSVKQAKLEQKQKNVQQGLGFAGSVATLNPLVIGIQFLSSAINAFQKVESRNFRREQEDRETQIKQIGIGYIRKNGGR